ncbi:hypothetical protein F4604DRAFT_1714468 [Suillus subluteus]|nr:hypothetical protein F4604DRAFT_1714468 [Suillus subluteus]
MKPLSLSDNNKLVAAYNHALRAITTLLTRAGVFLISLGIDGHIVSRGVARELQGIVTMIEDLVEHMINSQNNAQANPVESEQKEEDGAALPRTPPRSAHLNQSPSLRPTPAVPSPAARYRASTPCHIAVSPVTFKILLYSLRNAPALFNHMRVVPTYQTPAHTLGLFGSPMTSRVTTPLAYGGHLSSVNTPRQIPPSFWRPTPKAHAVKLMVPDNARHRKKAGKENEEEVSVSSAASRLIPSLSE